VDAIEHLRAVLEADPHSCTDMDQKSYCAHCGVYQRFPCTHEEALAMHTSDCPWLAAKAFVEAEDRKSAGLVALAGKANA
jgi:hypothetical protein